MKSNRLLIAVILVIIFLASPELFPQGIKKEMGVTYVRWKITDSADEGEGSWGWGESKSWYFGFEGGGVNSTKAVMMGKIIPLFVKMSSDKNKRRGIKKAVLAILNCPA